MKWQYKCSKAKTPQYQFIEKDEEQANKNEAQEQDIRRENGLQLTFILTIFLIICCLSWTLTCWIAAKKNDDVIVGDKCSLIPDDLRFDCHPDTGVDEASCLDRGCCWNPKAGISSNPLPLDVPYCYYPGGYSLYNRSSTIKTQDQITHSFQNTRKSGFLSDIENIEVQVTCFDKDILRVKIVDLKGKRYEVPFTNFENVARPLNECKLEYVSMGSKLEFQIRRKDEPNAVLFDSSNAGAFVYSNQFLQLSSILPSKFLYGLGEHRKPFLKDFNWKQYSFWNADQWPSASSTNLYGSHPFYISTDPMTKSTYGMLWLNSNGMEAVLQPTPAITMRSLGGVFDLFFLNGPDPIMTVMQYSKIVGRPFLPPYWSLGYHQCKFEYGTLNRTKQILKQTQDARIPIDVQWNDIDYMDARKDFTFNPKKFAELPKFVDELHEKGLHYIPIIDPGISSTEKDYYKPYNLGLELDIFIKNSSGQPFTGRVWSNGLTVWPDFTNPKTTFYWTEMFEEYHNQVAFDGVWIDMNEPSNFFDGQAKGCEKNPLNQPQYIPRSVDGHKLYHKTVCPSAKQYLGSHYDLHNIYGYSEGIATNKALKAIRGKRPFIISRSTFPGYGHFGGHWTGDVLSDWSSMHDSITGIMNFNLFGIPMVGADICGFNGNTTAALCKKWMQLGAFYPFSRNHNTDNGIDQDPVSLGPEVVESAREALNLRYSILPYLYSLFVKAHLFGSPVVKPTFFHAQLGDEIPYFLDKQYFLGDLLIVPALKEDEAQVEAYLPTGTIWYDLRTYKKIHSGPAQFVPLEAEKIPVLVKGGVVIPSQKVGAAKTTTQSQKLPIRLLIFLDDWERAFGSLYWDDGDSLETYEKEKYSKLNFKCSENRCTSKISRNSSLIPLPKMEAVVLTGIKRIIEHVRINGKNVDGASTYDKDNNIIVIDTLDIDMGHDIEITWE